MNVVLDTNVLISGLKMRGGTCARVLDLVVEGRLTLCAGACALPAETIEFIRGRHTNESDCP